MKRAITTADRREFVMMLVAVVILVGMYFVDITTPARGVMVGALIGIACTNFVRSWFAFFRVDGRWTWKRP